MKILGISAYYHDSAAAIIVNNSIVAAVQEERFSRKKNDANFPTKSIEYCLQYAGIALNDLDAIVFYDKPFLKFERLLETYYTNAPFGFISFMKAMPVWLKEKIFLRKIIKDELQKLDPLYNKKKGKLLFTEHHLSHAASSFFASPFSNAAILTIDGVGEWATASICIGDNKNISVLKELHFPDSVGLLYSSFTYYLGFKVNSGEYKLMGLAPYGNLQSQQTIKFIKIIENILVEVFENGSIKLNQKYFNFSTGLTMVDKKLWEQLFEIPYRASDEPILTSHCNLAIAIQHVTEKIILMMAKHTKEITGQTNLCLAGGVALNCVANGKLDKSNLFKNIYIQPAAGDAGGALGAALAANHIYFGRERDVLKNYKYDKMNNAFLGPEFSTLDILPITRKYNAPFEIAANEDKRNHTIITFLEQGKIIGLFQGRMEYGPRSLGNRSIIADASNVEMQKKINLKIKFRESFRPFAAVTTEEDVNNYFDHKGSSPYMLGVYNIQQHLKYNLDPNYLEKTPEQKLNSIRSAFPAITHVDGSCRIQTCNVIENPKMWKLLTHYKRLTNKSILINTSFNVRGEPIVCNPEDAYIAFMNTEMDVLIINNFIFIKNEQPEWCGISTVNKFKISD
jgi:carbamoyltransferase